MSSKPSHLAYIVTDAYRVVAPKKLVAELDARDS